MAGTISAGATTASLAGLLAALAPAALSAPLPPVNREVALDLATGRFAAVPWRLSAARGARGELCLLFTETMTTHQLCTPRGTDRDPGPGVWGDGNLGAIGNGDVYVFGAVNRRARRVRIRLKAAARPRFLRARPLPGVLGWRMRYFVGTFHGEIAGVAMLDASGRVIRRRT